MRRLVPILCACAMLLAHASAARAQPPGTAREHAKKLFDEGIELEKKADYVAALTKYKEAEQITATAGLRFHEGYCLEMTGKLAAAIEIYDAADRMAREQNKQDVHAAITARVEPLRARVPQISIRLATPAKDAEVQLDGVAIAAASLDGSAFRLDPGAHVVTARAAGYKGFTRKVQVPESVTTTVDVILERAVTAPVGEPAPSHVTEPPSEPPRSRSPLLPIAATGGAVALAGVGLASFLVAGSKQRAAKRDCLEKTTCDHEQSTVRTFDALALGGFIGAAGLGVVAVVLWTSKGEGRAAPSRARAVFAPDSLGVEGTFW